LPPPSYRGRLQGRNSLPLLVQGVALPFSPPAAAAPACRDALREVARRRQHLSQAGGRGKEEEEGFASPGCAGCRAGHRECSN